MGDQTRNRERELITRINAGHKDDYRHLVEGHKDKIFSLVMRQVGRAEVAEEITQETFVKAFLSLKKFRSDSSFATWLTRIALNTTHSYFKSRKYRQSLRNEQLSDEIANSLAAAPEEQSAEQQLHLFQLALATLKPKLRDALVLCALENKSYEEAATILDIPVGTVRSRLHKARLLLKQELSAQFSLGTADEY